jgi:hypothetical protein
MHELVEVDRHLPDHVDEIGPDTHKAAGYLWGDVIALASPLLRAIEDRRRAGLSPNHSQFFLLQGFVLS